MKAVNLIPNDARRGGAAPGGPRLGPGLAVIAVLALAVALVTVYVLTTNTIADRRARLATLQAEVAQAQSQAAHLANYAEFARLAQTRLATIKQIAASRFDWHRALSDLSRVVPADTSLQSLLASVSPSGGAIGGGSTSGLRNAISAPAFELTGCTRTQDDVARLMSRLRLINGVTRVTLGTSQKPDGSQPGAVANSASPSTGAAGGHGCPPNTPSFDLVVFFAPVPGAAATTASKAGGGK